MQWSESCCSVCMWQFECCGVRSWESVLLRYFAKIAKLTSKSKVSMVCKPLFMMVIGFFHVT